MEAQSSWFESPGRMLKTVTVITFIAAVALFLKGNNTTHLVSSFCLMQDKQIF